MIPLTKPYYGHEELEAIKRVMDSGWIAQGPECERFERNLEAYLGVKHAITVSSGTAALYLALLACGIGEGDEVLVPSFTFPATALAVVWTGASPVFIGSRQDYTMDWTQIYEEITDDTKAIIPVHLFGTMCQMDEIMEFAYCNNLYIIEDAACAFGSIYKNKFAGTIGDIGCFSLHAKKVITTGEGGIAVTNDDDLAYSIRLTSAFGALRTFERKSDPQYNGGFNLKLSDIAAAIGSAQLDKIERIFALRRYEREAWDEIILEDKVLRKCFKPDKVDRGSKISRSVCQSYVRTCVTEVKKREAIDYLNKKGFEVGMGSNACHTLPVFEDDRYLPDCKGVETLQNLTISLPIYPRLNLKGIWKL